MVLACHVKPISMLPVPGVSIKDTREVMPMPVLQRGMNMAVLKIKAVGLDRIIILQNFKLKIVFS